MRENWKILEGGLERMPPTSWAGERHSFRPLGQQVKTGGRLALRSREAPGLNAADPQAILRHLRSTGACFRKGEVTVVRVSSASEVINFLERQPGSLAVNLHMPVLSACCFSWGEGQFNQLVSGVKIPAIPLECVSKAAPGTALCKHWVPGYFTDRGLFSLVLPATRCLRVFSPPTRLYLLKNNSFSLF